MGIPEHVVFGPFGRVLIEWYILIPRVHGSSRVVCVGPPLWEHRGGCGFYSKSVLLESEVALPIDFKRGRCFDKLRSLEASTSKLVRTNWHSLLGTLVETLQSPGAKAYSFA